MLPQDTIFEEWRPIPGYEGVYSASSLGRIRSDRRSKNSYPGRVLRPHPDREGRLFVNLRRDGHVQCCRVHRLVALTFLGAPPLGTEVNHIDGDHQHNAANNLEYITPAANVAHAVRLGLVAYGERRPETHLTDADILAIRLSDEPRAVLAARYNLHVVSIGKIQRGDRWQRADGPVSRLGPGEYPRPAPPLELLQAIRNSTESNRKLAARYGISQSKVQDIRTGKRWGHLT